MSAAGRIVPVRPARAARERGRTRLVTSVRSAKRSRKMPTALQLPASRPAGNPLGRTISGAVHAARPWIPFTLLACTPRPHDINVNVTPRESSAERREAPAVAPNGGNARVVGGAASLTYRAPPRCPDEAHFLEQLAARSKTRLDIRRRGEANPSSSEVRVLIDEHPPNEWTGRVLLDGDRGEVMREVRGASCDEVVVALALITSFWMTAKAEARPEEQARPKLLEPPSSDSGSDDPLQSANLEDGEQATDYGSHLLGTVGYAFSPAGAAKAGLRFELWGGESASTWAAGATVSYLSGHHTSARLGTSSVVSLLAQLDLCPPGIDFAGPTWLRACAQARAGSLRFQAPADSLDDALPVWRPWAAAGIGLHGGVQLSSSYSLRVLSELSANFVRDAFDTERPIPGEPSVEASRLYRPGWVALDLAIGVSYDF